MECNALLWPVWTLLYIVQRNKYCHITDTVCLTMCSRWFLLSITGVSGITGVSIELCFVLLVVSIYVCNCLTGYMILGLWIQDMMSMTDSFYTAYN